MGEAILIKSLAEKENFEKTFKKENEKIEKLFVENEKKEFKKKLEAHIKQRIELTQELIFEPQNKPIYLTQDDCDNLCYQEESTEEEEELNFEPKSNPLYINEDDYENDFEES